jgi:hypothetical protein
MNGHYRLASACRTSDWDKPNCRAICDGLNSIQLFTLG